MALPMQHLSTNIVPFLTGALPENSQFNCVSRGSVLPSFYLPFSHLPINAALKKKKKKQGGKKILRSIALI